MTQTKVEAPFVANNFAHFKNLIINGDFRIFQRASGSTAVGNGTYSTADRFKTHFSNDGAATSQQHTMSDADRATTGHSFAWQWDVGTADGTIGSGQTCYFRQFIEAQNCSGLAYGSSAAKTLTLSFWVKSAKTGTYCCTIHKHDSTTYNLPLEYTISSADTWEHKTLVVSPTAGSTSLITGSAGDITQDNGKGIIIVWWLAAGADFHGTNNTWSSNTNHLATSNQVNWLDSTSNDFYITGIQFEIGDQATDFEHLPFDVQLIRCQRYFYNLSSLGPYVPDSEAAYLGTGFMYSSSYMLCNVHLPVAMRTEPSLTTSNASNHFMFYRNSAGDNCDDLTLSGSSSAICATVQNNTDVSGTAGHAGGLVVQAGSTCELSAEL